MFPWDFGFLELTELYRLYFSSVLLSVSVPESDVNAPYLDLAGFKLNTLGLII